MNQPFVTEPKNIFSIISAIFSLMVPTKVTTSGSKCGIAKFMAMGTPGSLAKLHELLPLIRHRPFEVACTRSTAEALVDSSQFTALRCVLKRNCSTKKDEIMRSADCQSKFPKIVVIQDETINQYNMTIHKNVIKTRKQKQPQPRF